MSKYTDPDLAEEALLFDADDDDATLPNDDWSLDEMDEFDTSADLSSLRSHWTGSDDRFE
jgi:hypothetical protein